MGTTALRRCKWWRRERTVARRAEMPSAALQQDNWLLVLASPLSTPSAAGYTNLSAHPTRSKAQMVGGGGWMVLLVRCYWLLHLVPGGTGRLRAAKKRSKGRGYGVDLTMVQSKVWLKVRRLRKNCYAINCYINMCMQNKTLVAPQMEWQYFYLSEAFIGCFIGKKGTDRRLVTYLM